jgi:hypothetical protein
MLAKYTAIYANDGPPGQSRSGGFAKPSSIANLVDPEVEQLAKFERDSHEESEKSIGQSTLTPDESFHADMPTALFPQGHPVD